MAEITIRRKKEDWLKIYTSVHISFLQEVVILGRLHSHRAEGSVQDERCQREARPLPVSWF